MTLADELEALAEQAVQEVIARFPEWKPTHLMLGFARACAKATALRAEAEKDAEIASLREALKPFADCASEWAGEPNALNVEFAAYDPPRMNPSALVADFRAARQALENRDGG